MSRSIEGLGFTATGFWFLCDCGVRTEVTFEGLPASQFAVTCDGCETPHWFTPVRRVPPPPRLPTPPLGATWPGGMEHAGHTVTLIELDPLRVRCSCEMEWAPSVPPHAWDPPVRR